MSRRGINEDADVIVVGAGPAGSTAATYLARAGLDVLLLEKSAFPREKVCGDGLTPRGVKQLIDLGIDTREENGWLHNKGLRVVGGGVTMELDWPELATFPNYGVVRPRQDFDEMLANTAKAAGARLHENTTVTKAIIENGRRASASKPSRDRKRTRSPTARRSPSPVTVCQRGWPCRVGLQKDDDKPDGRRGPPLLHEPAHQGRLPRVAPRAVGAGRQAAARLRLDLRHGRRHRERRSRHSEHVKGLRHHGLPPAPALLARRHAGRVGLPRGERDEPHRRRRVADGPQPQAALPNGPAARR